MSVDAPFTWSPGLTIERSSLLYSDGGLGLVTADFPEERAREEQRRENQLDADPAHRVRYGVVQIKVLSIEDPRPPASLDVRELLTRVRALPRLTATMKAEIDAVLARLES